MIPYSSKRPSFYRLLTLLIPLSVSIVVSSSYGATPQQMFKKDVIEDCMAAKRALPTMQEQERIESVSYLTKVAGFRLKDESLKDQISLLGLGSSGKNAVNAPAVGSSSIIARDELVRSLDPSREDTARACALEILASLLPYSIESIPDLLILLTRDSEVSSDSAFPIKLRLLIQSLAIGIKEYPSSQPSQIFWEKIITQATESDSPVIRAYSRSILRELGPLSLNRLRDKILTSVASPNLESLLKLMIEISEDPTPSREIFQELLINEKTEVRLLALDSIRAYNRVKWDSNWIELIIARLGDFSPGVRSGAASALKKVITDLTTLNSPSEQSIKINPEKLDVLVNAFINGDISEKDKLATPLNVLAKPLDDLAREKLATRVIDHILASPSVSLEPPEISVLLELAGSSSRVGSLLEKTLISSKSKSRRFLLEAFFSYPKIPASFKKPIAILIQQAKSPSATADQLAAVSDIIQVLPNDPASVKALLSSDTAYELLKLAPRVLSDERSLLKTQVLAEIIGPYLTLEIIIKNLKIDHEQNKIFALNLAKGSGAFNKELINTLISTLVKMDQISNNLQFNIASYLITPEIQPKFKKELPRLKRLTKIASVEKSLAINFAISSIDSTLSNGLDTLSQQYKVLPCNQRAKIAEFIVGNRSDLDLSIIECISDPSLAVQEAIINWMINNSPLDIQRRSRLVSSLVSVKPHPKTLTNLLDKLEKLGISNKESVPLWVSLLNNEDRLAQIEALDRLYSHPEIVLELGEEIDKMEATFKELPAISRELKLLAALGDPSGKQAEKFMVEQFKERDLTWALDRLHRLPKAVAVLVLESVFSELSIPDEIPTLRAIGNLKLVELRSKVEARLDASLGSLRYVASVSSLNLDPLGPRSKLILERELFGEFNQQLFKEKFPQELQFTLNELIASSSSSVVKHTAIRLLESF